MNTKFLLSASAAVMAVGGLAASFMPHELIAQLHVPPSDAMAVLIQLLGALLFAFALMNWTARGSLMGGIYNRPLAIGNLLHFAAGACALVKAVMAGVAPAAAVLTLAIVYTVFAVAFTTVVFGSPVRSVPNTSDAGGVA
jgi:hypothetical protein